MNVFHVMYLVKDKHAGCIINLGIWMVKELELKMNLSYGIDLASISCT